MKKCVECENKLSGNQRKYCSNACKQRGHWNREKNKGNTYHRQTLRAYERKLMLIEKNGGSCKECNYDKNMAALQFHHKDPTKKLFALDARNLSNRNLLSIIEEASKCDLLCANCHSEHHNPEMTLNNVLQLLEDVSADVTKIRIINKPKCIDCDIDLGYKSKRCKKCEYKNRRKVERPDLRILQSQVDEHNYTWCAIKYEVSRKTIKRWLERQIS
jgi:hypothetical protein